MSDYAMVRMRRPNGLEVVLRVPAEHLQMLMNIANDTFGNSRAMIGRPKMPIGKGQS